jgi:hypothetical protein
MKYYHVVSFVKHMLYIETNGIAELDIMSET